MSTGNEIDEVSQRMSGVVIAVIQASTQLAQAIIELRIEALRRAAQQERERAQELRERVRAHHQADSAVWRAAMRPQWWRDAGAEDIGRVWRAASTWQHVDPRAAAARQVVVDRLAERGVRIDPNDQTRPSPEDTAWLSDALDRVAAARAAAQAAGRARTPGAAREGAASADPGAGPVIDGEFREDVEPAAGRGEHRTTDPAQERLAREARAAAHVRAAWSGERAESVVACKAWGALAYQLGQLEEQGHDVELLLQGVPNFIDRAHTPAAFAFRSIEERLEDAADQAVLNAEKASATSVTADADPERIEPPWEVDESALTLAEMAGQRLAGDASAEQVQAAGTAYWSEQKAAARADTNQASDPWGYTPGNRALRADNRRREYEGGITSPFHALGSEEHRHMVGILAKLKEQAGGELAAAVAERAVERDERAGQRHAEQTVNNPREVGRDDVDRAREQADLHADLAAGHEARAAQLAAQGFPVSTKEAVTAAADKATAGAAAGAAGRGRGRPATGQRPGAQRSRREPKGR